MVNRWKFVANRFYVQQKVHSDTVLYPDFNPLNKFLLTLFVTSQYVIKSCKSFVNRSKTDVNRAF